MNTQTEMKYRIAVDRQEIGEFDVDFITEMVQSGQIVTENAHYLDVGTKRWIPLEELVEPLLRQQQPVIRANAVRNGRLPSEKTRCVYIVLGFFLGGLGVHNFYAGRNRAGLMQVVLTGISLGTDVRGDEREGFGVQFCTADPAYVGVRVDPSGNPDD